MPTMKNIGKNRGLQSLNTATIPLPIVKENDRTLSLLNNTIDTVNAVGSLVPFELAKGVLTTVSSILTRVKDTIKNQDDFIELAERCSNISLLIWRATSGTPENDISPTILRAISESKKSVDRIQAAIIEKTENGVGSRVFHVAVNKETIGAWQRDLDRILIIFNTELNIAINLKLDDLVSMLAGFRNDTNLNTDAPLPEVLPAIPPIFFGRNTIVQETVESLLTCHHVALIGPGGMGKSYIARAVLHDEAISAKFKDRRFFVRYDDIDASQITYGSFLDRLAGALGIRVSKANQRSLISNALSSREILLVLDNAETFLDATLDAGRIAASIDEFGALPNVAIMLTTRTEILPLNLIWERLPIPPLDESPACEVFRMIYRPEIQPEILTKLLSSLDFHPLSINLLAHAAVQNKWTPEELVKRWKGQKASLLNSGRVQSLAITIELSLNSPSLKNLGDIALNLSQVIAFLPQGILYSDLEIIFSTTANIQSAADTLCNHSLAYRKGDFITMLAPIRLYISMAYKYPSLYDIPMLTDVRRYYVTKFKRDPVDVDGDWIRTEDVNLEYIIALILGQSDPTDMLSALFICQHFIRCLIAHKPRSTSFFPVLLALQTDHSTRLSCLNILTFSRNKNFLVAKGDCLARLGELTFYAGHYLEARQILAEAKQVYTACGNAGREGLRVIQMSVGGTYEELGDFRAAEEILSSALKKRKFFKSENTLDVLLNTALGFVKIARGQPEGIKLLLKAQKYHFSIGNDDIAFYIALQIGCDDLSAGKNDSARGHFSNLWERATDMDIRLPALVAMVDVSRREGKTAEAKTYLDRLRQNAQEMTTPEKRISPLSMLAAYIAMDGNISEARDELSRLVAEARALSSISLTVMKVLYVAAIVELLADDRTLAGKLFLEVLYQCEALMEVRFKTRTTRALGEVSYLDGDFAKANARFSETKSLCEFMGIPLDRLYYCEGCYILSDDFQGWKLFREGRLGTSMMYVEA